MKYLLLLLAFSCVEKKDQVIKLPDSPINQVTESVKFITDYVKISSCDNCTDQQWARIKESEALVNKVSKTECFKNKIIEGKFLETTLSNQEIYNQLTKEISIIETSTYYTLKRVLGYTYDGPKIWINRRYMMSWNAVDLASLIVHEVSHVKGFTHAYKYYNGRERTVPYALNSIIEECAK